MLGTIKSRLLKPIACDLPPTPTHARSQARAEKAKKEKQRTAEERRVREKAVAMRQHDVVRRRQDLQRRNSGGWVGLCGRGQGCGRNGRRRGGGAVMGFCMCAYAMFWLCSVQVCKGVSTKVCMYV